jgi:prolyl 4-hydroxylase
MVRTKSAALNFLWCLRTQFIFLTDCLLLLRPLEVIGHDGIAHNVTMEPGDLLLYESHSVIHGHQFPLKGGFVANLFIHFEPVGPLDGTVDYNGDLPPYIIPGSEEEAEWRVDHPEGHRISTDAHRFVRAGDIESLTKFLDENQDAVQYRDADGWTPLAEAVHNRDLEAVKLLLDRECIRRQEVQNVFHPASAEISEAYNIGKDE